MQMVSVSEVYYFGRGVCEHILLSCLTLDRADLVGKVVEHMYGKAMWIDIQAQLQSVCMSESMEAGALWYMPAHQSLVQL